MVIHMIQDKPTAELAAALASFEQQFTYPLGPGRSFRISHGEDYARFFRAMGTSAVFVAERDGLVLGTVAAALRRLRLPDGREICAGHLCDLKIVPGSRGTRTMMDLFRSLQRADDARAEALLTVVMDGTAVLPGAYSGRFGIPALTEVGRITILRIPTATEPEAEPHDTALITTMPAAGRHYLDWTRGHYALSLGDPVQRSILPPQPYAIPDGAACGILEDTRHAKRLYTNEGELLSAHLSAFAYRDLDAACHLLRAVLARAAEYGFPALFTSVDARDADELADRLKLAGLTAAGATVYGAGLEPGARWSLNTAEI